MTAAHRPAYPQPTSACRHCTHPIGWDGAAPGRVGEWVDPFDVETDPAHCTAHGTHTPED